MLTRTLMKWIRTTPKECNTRLEVSKKATMHEQKIVGRCSKSIQQSRTCFRLCVYSCNSFMFGCTVRNNGYLFPPFIEVSCVKRKSTRTLKKWIRTTSKERYTRLEISCSLGIEM